MPPVSQKTLNIGLLIESEGTCACAFEFTQWAQRQSHLIISHLIRQNISNKRTTNRTFPGPTGIAHFLRRLLFQLLTQLEMIRLRREPAFANYRQRYDLSKVIPASLCIAPTLAEGCSSYCYSARDLESIKSLNLDLIITTINRRFVSDLVLSTKFGIVSFDQNEDPFHPSASAFWEVYLKKDTTPFAIWHQTGSAAAGTRMIFGTFPTKHFYLLNQASQSKKIAYYLSQLVSHFCLTHTWPGPEQPNPEVSGRVETPSVRDQLRYGFAQIVAVLAKVAGRLTKREQRWGVAFARSAWQTLSFSSATTIDNPTNHFLADPFVLTEDGRSFCFVEDYDYGKKLASIVVYELEGKNAKKLGTALEEPFHLSFPYLFRFQGKLYMCPETCQSRDIRLYECVTFPLRWKLAKTVMNDVQAVDTMIFEYGGHWWLFTNIDPTEAVDCCSELFIFYADNPLSNEWKPHPKNPVVLEASKARNGGLLVGQDGDVYRVGQGQGFDQYGKYFSINKIDVLTTVDYAESTTRIVEPVFFEDIVGTHHFHSNNDVSVFDFVRVDRIRK